MGSIMLTTMVIIYVVLAILCVVAWIAISISYKYGGGRVKGVDLFLAALIIVFSLLIAGYSLGKTSTSIPDKKSAVFFTIPDNEWSNRDWKKDREFKWI